MTQHFLCVREHSSMEPNSVTVLGSHKNNSSVNKWRAESQSGQKRTRKTAEPLFAWSTCWSTLRRLQISLVLLKRTRCGNRTEPGDGGAAHLVGLIDEVGDVCGFHGGDIHLATGTAAAVATAVATAVAAAAGLQRHW